jgi:hypothetical protein
VTADAVQDLARRGHLYPSVILHGAGPEARQEVAVQLGQTLLCERDAPARPCSAAPCRHCARVHWPGSGQERFHPDFHVLERDLRTSTSVDATKNFLKEAQVAPFEARGQVFVIAAADSLTGEAANALLKALEEPHETSPRNFFLLAPSQFDLLPTLRSRSLALYLGPAEVLDPAEVQRLAEPLAACLEAHARTGAVIHLLAAATVLSGAGDFKDVRAGRPWALAARALVQCSEGQPQSRRRRLLDLAQALLEAPALRLRSIAADRILEGLLVRHLAMP